MCPGCPSFNLQIPTQTEIPKFAQPYKNHFINQHQLQQQQQQLQKQQLQQQHLQQQQLQHHQLQQQLDPNINDIPDSNLQQTINVQFPYQLEEAEIGNNEVDQSPVETSTDDKTFFQRAGKQKNKQAIASCIYI